MHVQNQFHCLPICLTEPRAHGLEEQHKLIVDSTSIAIPQPNEPDQHKVYYHAKSPTNYAVKMQTACDFHHRIVDDLDKITKHAQVVCALCNMNLNKHPICR